MSGRWLPWAAAIATTVLAPLRASAQGAPSAHWFLEEWAERVWLQILDRQGGSGGPFSANGLLLRFDPRIDEEYRLDLLATRFTLGENADWHARNGGFRWRAGSITKRDMATFGEMKASVPVSDRWRFGIRFDLEDHVRADRALVRARFDWSASPRYLAYAEGSLDPRKPGSDLEFGARWLAAPRGGPSAHVGFAVLDWVNDLIYVSLDAAGGGEVESTIVYDRHPLAARGALELPLAQALRLTARAGYVRPSVVRTYAGVLADSGFRQRERMGFAGGLLAWDLSGGVQLSLVATYVEARSERARLSPAVPVDEYSLTERTTEVGGLASARLGGSAYLDVLALKVHQVERRDNRTAPASSVDYADRAWTGEVLVARRPHRGLAAEVGMLFDTRDVVRGAGQVPGGSARVRPHQGRARADIGWRFGEQASFMIGSAVDLDVDGVARRFDGIRGRFLLLW
jgi:hypothetical protein